MNKWDNYCDGCDQQYLKICSGNSYCVRVGCNSSSVQDRSPYHKKRYLTSDACIPECHWCVKNKSNKEPMSRYDWAYS